MHAAEKRSDTRLPIRIPLRFWILDHDSAESENCSETCNISHSGLFMRSPCRMPVGTPLCMLLRVPTDLSGHFRSHFRTFGRIVHEKRLPDGDWGYGVRFEKQASFRFPLTKSRRGQAA